MGVEIEARYLECDVEEIISKLKANGAKFIGDWLQIRNCYDFNPVKPNSWIRLRTTGKETTLTIKEINSSEIDGTKEWETKVDSFEVVDEMLNKMGYYARSKQENRRIRYILDGVEVDIDFWPLIPAYVEFEGESESAIIAVCEKLGISAENLTSLDVASIYQAYGFSKEQMNDLSLEEERKIVVFEEEKE